MKRVIILLTTIVAMCGNINSQSNFTAELQKELKLFIDTIQSSRNDPYYIEYIAKFYHEQPSKKDFCFTLGFILNEYDWPYIKPNYVFDFNDRIILVIIDPIHDKKIIKDLRMRKISESEILKIKKRLYPASKGGSTYRASGLTYCHYKDKISKTYYSHSDDIPFSKSIDQ